MVEIPGRVSQHSSRATVVYNYAWQPRETEGGPCILNSDHRRVELSDIHRVHELTKQLYPHEYLDEGLGAIGLFLYDPPTKAAYAVTPLNSMTFGGIGVDGIHFASITDNAAVDPMAPVVMSIPMALETPNFIVGETMYDFLCLGCRHGYSNLGNLHLHREEVIRYLQGPPKSFFDERSEAILQTLCDELSLTPWMDVGARFEEMQSKYAKTLRLQTHP